MSRIDISPSPRTLSRRTTKVFTDPKTPSIKKDIYIREYYTFNDKSCYLVTYPCFDDPVTRLNSATPRYVVTTIGIHLYVNSSRRFEGRPKRNSSIYIFIFLARYFYRLLIIESTFVYRGIYKIVLQVGSS